MVHCAFFWAKQNVPLNSVPTSFFFKFRLNIIVLNFYGKVMSGFQVTLVSKARMHTCVVQAYHERPHNSYHSDSEINFLSDN